MIYERCSRCTRGRVRSPTTSRRCFPAQDTRCKQRTCLCQSLFNASMDRRLPEEGKKGFHGEPNNQKKSGGCQHHERFEIVILRLAAQGASCSTPSNLSARDVPFDSSLADLLYRAHKYSRFGFLLSFSLCARRRTKKQVNACFIVCSDRVNLPLHFVRQHQGNNIRVCVMHSRKNSRVG